LRKGDFYTNIIVISYGEFEDYNALVSREHYGIQI